MKLSVDQLENKFDWEPDPLYFIFNQEIPGKVRMHTKRMDWKDWIKIDRTYPAQLRLRGKLLETRKDDIFVTNVDQSTCNAKYELLMKVIDHLCKHFPDKFEHRENGIYNKILEEFVSSDEKDAEDPLIRAGTKNNAKIANANVTLDSTIDSRRLVYS